VSAARQLRISLLLLINRIPFDSRAPDTLSESMKNLGEAEGRDPQGYSKIQLRRNYFRSLLRQSWAGCPFSHKI
jgi:hypothetical protein